MVLPQACSVAPTRKTLLFIDCLFCALLTRRRNPLLYALTMCRNIRTLHNFEPPAKGSEVHDAALQYVRKISGTTKPSQANAEVFERAVEEIAHATQHLLDGLVSNAPPKDREVEAAKRKARSAERFAA
ncbi:MAG TPA: DUF2277 domain-containing protein [Solirubrobacteraceae bacterium]|nr:DUF2277 domain-containing protein [Solirubrobacteraceae bacterium]